MTGRRQSRGPSAPKAVLEHIGRQIGVAAPEIASLRTLSRREATRAAHEAAARAVMGFKELSAGARSQLVAYLRAESAATSDLADLERRARVWLYSHATVAPPARALEDLCRNALRRREATLAADIRTTLGDAQVDAWIDALSERVGDGVTRHEWLRGGPRKKSILALRDQSAKVRWLQELGAATAALDGLPTTLITAYARRVELRRPVQQRRIREPRRTLETACFLRRQLARNTDLLADLFGLCVTDCWRQAHEAATAAEARKTPDYRRATLSIHAAVFDPALSDAESRKRVAALVAPLLGDARGPTSRVGVARLSLADAAAGIRAEPSRYYEEHLRHISRRLRRTSRAYAAIA
jgi:hypothetical protein